MTPQKPRIGLFVTCLVDLFRPTVGFAAVKLLGATGCDVVVVERSPGPREQGYMIDFFGTGYEAAEAMGILPALRFPNQTESASSVYTVPAKACTSV